MNTVKTNYTQLVKLLQLMRADNGQIFLDAIEASLHTLSDQQLEDIAMGEEQEQIEALTKLPHSQAKALEAILHAAFDGV